MRLPSFVRAAALCCVATTASAQSGDREPRQTLGTNLLAIPFGIFSLDYEHVVGRGGITVGLGALHVVDVTDDDGPFWWDGELTWAQAKLKYYPGEVSLRGLAVGVTAGAVQERRYEYEPYDPSRPTTQPARVRRSDTAPTIGVVVDYNWLLGRNERFLLGIGIGAKRVLKDVRENYDCCAIYDPTQPPRHPSPLQQVYPDGRFTVGFAF